MPRVIALFTFALSLSAAFAAEKRLLKPEDFAAVREIGIMHHAYEAQRNDLIARLRETLPKVPVRKVEYPPSLATYIGPNTLGVVVYEGTY